jgi:hypothetical protein
MATVYTLEMAMTRADERSRQDGECYAVYEHRTNKGDFLVMNSGAATPQNFVRVYEAMPPHRQPT